MSRKELTAALKGQARLTKRVAELTEQRQMVLAELKDKKKNMAKAVMAGADAAELSADIAQLETNKEAFDYSLDLGRQQVQAANKQLAELRREENAKEASENCKEARKVFTELVQLDLVKRHEQLQGLLNKARSPNGFSGEVGLMQNTAIKLRELAVNIEHVNAALKERDRRFAR